MKQYRAEYEKWLAAESLCPEMRAELLEQKAAMEVDIGAKQAGGLAALQVERLPYHPLRDLKTVRGTLAEITGADVLDMDYVFVTLTDELPPLDPMGSLLQSYPNLVQYRVENSRTTTKESFVPVERVEEKDPLEHFVHFFSVQNNGQLPSEAQMELIRQVIMEAEVHAHASN